MWSGGCIWLVLLWSCGVEWSNRPRVVGTGPARRVGPFDSGGLHFSLAPIASAQLTALSARLTITSSITTLPLSGHHTLIVCCFSFSRFSSLVLLAHRHCTVNYSRRQLLSFRYPWRDRSDDECYHAAFPPLACPRLARSSRSSQSLLPLLLSLLSSSLSSPPPCLASRTRSLTTKPAPTALPAAVELVDRMATAVHSCSASLPTSAS